MRLLQEIKKTCLSTGRHAAGMVRNAGALWARRSAGDKARAAVLALGERAYQAGLGEPPQRAQIASLNNQLHMARAGNEPIEALRHERAKLLTQVAAQVMKQEPPPGALTEQMNRVKQAGTAAGEHGAHLRKTRATIFPEDGPTRWRLAVGYGTSVLCMLFLVIFLFKPASSAPESRGVSSPTTIAAVGPIGQPPVEPVGTKNDKSPAPVQQTPRAPGDEAAQSPPREKKETPLETPSGKPSGSVAGTKVEDAKQPELPEMNGDQLIPWNEVQNSLRGEPEMEVGKRDDQRYVLLNRRLLVIEGTRALDVFFPASQEGLLAGQAFLSSPFFTPAERQQLVGLLKSRSEGERHIGRFKARLGVTPNEGTLPSHWISVKLEPATAPGKLVLHAIRLSGIYTFDQLFTESKFREVNRLVKSHLGTGLSQQELGLRIRTLDNLADGAGYSAAVALTLVRRAIEEAQQKGLEPALGISAAASSFAFIAATDQQPLKRWRSGGKAPDDGSPAPAKGDEERAVAAILKLGGKVTRDPKQPDRPVVSVRLGNAILTDADLHHLQGLTELVDLYLGETRLTDDGLKHLQGLGKLRSLNLGVTNVTDDGLKHLQGLGKLRSLNLAMTKVTDDGLKHLQGLGKLRSLNLFGVTKITDRGLDHLAALPELEDVTLIGTRVSEKGIEKLKKALPRVEISSFTEEERELRKKVLDDLEKLEKSGSVRLPVAPPQRIVESPLGLRWFTWLVEKHTQTVLDAAPLGDDPFPWRPTPGRPSPTWAGPPRPEWGASPPIITTVSQGGWLTAGSLEC
jgi:hypothetical protein